MSAQSNFEEEGRPDSSDVDLSQRAVNASPADEPAPKAIPAQEELKGFVSLWGTIAITLYLILVTLILGYAVLAFWPADLSSAGQDVQSTEVTFLGGTFRVFGEVRVLVLISLIGALGAQLRCIRSLYWYIGNRKLVWSWTVMYILLPFVGAILGMIFYFVIRAGFFSPSATIQDANPIGFIALAALAGMFSEQAVLKLKEVAETLLDKPPAGSDAVPQEKDTK
jgi:hypothetical protein